MTEQIFDVAVVGYGPTGATLANLLADQNLQVLVIDREADIYKLPRAVHFDDETMRVFQTVGIADALSEYVYINPGMKFQDKDGNLLLDWPRDQNITTHGWNASYRLHQPDLEKLLRQQLSNRDNVQEVLSCQVQNVKEHQDYAELNCKSTTTSQGMRYRAKYVVGCDGANSLVRKTIGSDLIDFGFCEKWLVTDFILKRPRPDLGDHSIQYCDSERPMTYCRSPGLRRRWEITILPNETDEEIANKNKVWELLANWITPQDAELERSAVYTFRSAIARQWHKGRLLIAGDAAHLTPPFMGQGMCTGIRDAANLAWKLTTTLKHNTDSLLLSYQKERSPHAQTYIETAIRLGGLINSIDQNSALQMAGDEARGKATIKSIQPKLGDSPYLNSVDSQPEHPVGLPFAQVTLNSGKIRFDDFVGYRHALITRDHLQHPITDSFLSLTAKDHPTLETELDKLNTDAVWVRPDRYIATTADSTENLLKQISLIKTPTL